jgi:hypothetical protein
MSGRVLDGCDPMPYPLRTRVMTWFQPPRSFSGIAFLWHVPPKGLSLDSAGGYACYACVLSSVDFNNNLAGHGYLL